MAIYVWDKSGNKKAWAGAEDDASLSKLGLSKTRPDSVVGNATDNPRVLYSSNNYPTSGTVWVTSPDGNRGSTSAANLQNMLERGFTYGGVRSSGLARDMEESEGNGRSLKVKTANRISINSPYDKAKQSLIDLIKQRIAEQKQALQPMRNNSEIQKAQELRAVLEQNANNGDRGGVGRMAALETQTAGANRLNAINLEASNIENQGNADIANISTQYDLEALRTAIEQQRYKDSLGQQDFQNRLAEAGLTGMYNGSPTMAKTQADNELKNRLESQQLERDIQSIGAYSNDFQAEINRRMAANPNDPFIPFLHAARNEKIARQKAEADASVNQTYKNAYNMWLQLGVATQEIANILGIPAGSKTIDKIKADYTTSKPYYNPNSGGSNGGNWWD